MTEVEFDNERKGNIGRAMWNARPQSAEDAQNMLAGAIRTIDRLLNVAWRLSNHAGLAQDRALAAKPEDGQGSAVHPASNL